MTNMSNKLIELLEDEGKRLIETADADMHGIKDKYIQLLDSRIQSMITMLELPEGREDIVALVERGGKIRVANIEAQHDHTRLNLSYEGYTAFNGYDQIEVKKGKYRVTLIIEPVDEEKGK